MREIKFRGRDLITGKFVYGDLNDWSYSPKIVVSKIGKTYDVDPETVGQFTDLLDKNGKQVFEGDIIAGLHIIRGIHGSPDRKEKFVGKVIYIPGYFYVDGIIMGHLITILENAEVEVIGNVWETPELLEQS